MTLTPEMIAEGWLPHDGGPCPVKGTASLGVLYRCGLKVRWSLDDHISDAVWRHDGSANDIIAYRPENPNG